MENLNTNNNVNEFEGNSLRDYIALIRLNLAPILWISFAGLIIAVIYALNATNIYQSTTMIKLDKPSGSILEGSLMPEFSDFGNDRFIANELEILQSYTIREKVTEALYDSFKVKSDDTLYYLILTHDEDKIAEGQVLKSVYDMTEMFDKKVAISQKRGLDIVEISVESPSAYEAALIANVYAEQYKKLNLAINRQQMVVVKEFLENQRKEKLTELNKAEGKLQEYQQEGGIIELSEQAKALIDQLTTFEADKNAAEIEMKIAQKSVNMLKKELSDQDPKLKAYIENAAVEFRRDELGKSIAQLETQRDFALANAEDSKQAETLANYYDNKIKELNKKLQNQLEIYKASIYASSPEEIKELTAQLFEQEIKLQSAEAKFNELTKIVIDYEKQFNELPQRSIELARLQREQQALEKLYLLVEEKYQESLINEQSTPGNVFIVDQARIAPKSAKPNRKLIVLVGLVLGLGLGFGFAFIKNYFDNTIKTPEDIQSRNVPVLAWVPRVEGLSTAQAHDFQFIVAKKPSSNAAEAYRALRTRLQYIGVDDDKRVKTILITSSAPSEGKTTTATNLAGSFSQAEKKVLVIDCDLRKPRMHQVFGANRYPGFTDYFMGNAEYDEIFRQSELENLKYVTAGTIPPNPSELLSSRKMLEFLNRVHEEYDYIILDSPPIISVTDAEILSRIADTSILVVSSETTDKELMMKSVELLQHGRSKFAGTVLNNFSYKSGYSSYYKYYHYYYSQAHTKED